jgi:hypothetical protein
VLISNPLYDDSIQDASSALAMMDDKSKKLMLLMTIFFFEIISLLFAFWWPSRAAVISFDVVFLVFIYTVSVRSQSACCTYIHLSSVVVNGSLVDITASGIKSYIENQRSDNTFYRLKNQLRWWWRGSSAAESFRVIFMKFYY